MNSKHFRLRGEFSFSDPKIFCRTFVKFTILKKIFSNVIKKLYMDFSVFLKYVRSIFFFELVIYIFTFTKRKRKNVLHPRESTLTKFWLTQWKYYVENVKLELLIFKNMIEFFSSDKLSCEVRGLFWTSFVKVQSTARK